MERKLKPVGILRRFRSQLFSIHPQLENSLLEVINTYLEDPLRTQFLEFFTRLPDRSLIGKKSSRDKEDYRIFM